MTDEFLDTLADVIEKFAPSGLLETLDRQRPYNGQPWTDLGGRGKTEIKGITFRDLHDCFIRACYDSAPIEPKDYPKSIFGLDWNKIDPMAVQQNMSCWVERYMGIFPNLPKLKEEDIWKDIPTFEIPEGR